MSITFTNKWLETPSEYITLLSALLVCVFEVELYFSTQPDVITSNTFRSVWNITSCHSPRSRYKELLNWVEAILSAQGLDKQAVSQALLRLSEPVRVENIRPQFGGEELAAGSEMELEDTTSSR